MRNVLLATLPIFFALAAPVAAQTPPADEETVTDDEVVVTARRREETLFEVPAAVSTISAADQQNFVIESTSDILRQLPSAALVNGGLRVLAGPDVGGLT